MTNTTVRSTTCNLTIDGRKIEAGEGQTVFDAASKVGIYIPNLCSYPGLKPLAGEEPDRACQLCIVEANGKVVRSCSTPVSEGLTVETSTPGLQKLRRAIVTSILRRHPNACLTCHRSERCGPFDICLRNCTVEERCVTCPKNMNCALQRVVDYVGVGPVPAYVPKKLPIREDSPFWVRDNNLCISCKRCVRVCRDIRGAAVIDFAHPCHTACPAGIDIPRYIRLVGRGRPSAALAVIRERVPFPGALGRVCVHPCEQACQRGKIADKPLNIRMLKRYAADHGDESWKKTSKKLASTGKKAAIIGAGPAGLTAAYYLAKQGHKVTVFEALPAAGGMMRVGIPEYRLPRDILSAEIKEIENAGVEIQLNSRIDSLDSLFEKGYNAVFLGIGSHQGMALGITGETSSGVIDAADFLRRANLGEKVAVGNTVGVVGGGNVAIDAARISLRLGAKKVTVFYRRTRSEMPANAEEVEGALEEGVEFVYLAAPQSVSARNGKLALECLRMELGAPDKSGRRAPVPVKGSEFTTEVDTLVAAIGQCSVNHPAFKIDLGKNFTVKVDKNMMTSREGVFSGGDCVTGPATVIAAIAAGRQAASAMDHYLGGSGDISEHLVSADEADCYLESALPDEALAKLTHLPAATRASSFQEVELGMEKAVAESESQRCLECHVISPIGETELQAAGCQFCGACVDACPTGALMDRSTLYEGDAGKSVATICPYCGVGCQLNAEVKDGCIISTTPDPEGPANHGQACVKGRYGITEFVHSPERLTKPLVRKGDKFVETSWDEALALIADRLGKYKGDQFSFVASAKATNEDNYVMQKFTRAVMQTNNVDHCARL